ncbi:MAG: hypothetical protein ACPLRU_01735, partial [Desulfofundulus sp.]
GLDDPMLRRYGYFPPFLWATGTRELYTYICILTRRRDWGKQKRRAGAFQSFLPFVRNWAERTPTA